MSDVDALIIEPHEVRMKTGFPRLPKHSETLRAGHATYIAPSFRGKLQGEPALVIVDQTAPWLVLAQFDNMERIKYFSHGWHPLPASGFGPIEYDHDWSEEPCTCKHCGVAEATYLEHGTPCFPS